jgi:uncharacterized protein
MRNRHLLVYSVWVMLLSTAAAQALTLPEARRDALVGEGRDGYVLVLQAKPDVAALVADINTKRRQEYARISQDNGQSPEVVAKLAAPQIIEGLPAGARYQDAVSGAWQTR